ncbi:MAG: hypothetical protein ACR2QH_00820 [Geminicoccaceae bacterium]
MHQASSIIMVFGRRVSNKDSKRSSSSCTKHAGSTVAGLEAPLYSTLEPLLLIGGAPVDAALMKRLAVGRSLVAADSGANTALTRRSLRA